MKYSNDCRRLSQVILTYRDTISILDCSSPDRLKPYKDLLLDLSINDPNAKDRVIELLKYQHYINEIEQLSQWILPRFPVSGGTLASKGIKQGSNYKTILNQLREAWKESHYQATENQLIDEVLPNILENLTDTNSSVSSLPKRRKEKE